MVSHYIYIYIYIWFRIELDLNSSVFVPNNLLATKIKKIDEQLAKKVSTIEIQFRI